jgi:hypothetical protein
VAICAGGHVIGLCSMSRVCKEVNVCKYDGNVLRLFRARSSTCEMLFNIVKMTRHDVTYFYIDECAGMGREFTEFIPAHVKNVE